MNRENPAAAVLVYTSQSLTISHRRFWCDAPFASQPNNASVHANRDEIYQVIYGSGTFVSGGTFLLAPTGPLSDVERGLSPECANVRSRHPPERSPPCEFTDLTFDREAPMKGSRSLLLMVVAASACSSTGGAPASPPRPVSWPIGEYALEATVEYRDDGLNRSNTVREDYSVDLAIGPGGSLVLLDPPGVCRDPTRPEVERDEALHRRTFRCGDLTYVVEPAGSTIRGELTATVNERIRRRGRCIERSYLGGCMEYRWYLNSGRTPKRARFTVVPRF